MTRVDIIAGAIERYGKSESPEALARHIDMHLAPERPELSTLQSIAHDMARIARCMENIDARQRDFTVEYPKDVLR